MLRNLNSRLRAFSLLLIGFLTLSCGRSGNPVPTPTPAPAPTLTPTATPTPTPPPASPSAPPMTVMPDEASMSKTDRRMVQDILRRLGYYKGHVDGVFGPSTRAAIRRFQRGIGAEMTGHLTAEEASRLVGTH